MIAALLLWAGIAVAQAPPDAPTGGELPSAAVDAIPVDAIPVDGQGDVAQIPDNAGLTSALGPPGPAPAPEQVDALTRQISSVLRCPVCQGMSVADSPSEGAVTMKGRIRELVALGYSGDQISAYFVSRYGEWVLLQPPAQGLNWVLWIAPGALLGVGLALSAALAAQWRREPDDVPLPSDQGLVAKDPYEARLLDELED